MRAALVFGLAVAAAAVVLALALAVLAEDHQQELPQEDPFIEADAAGNVYIEPGAHDLLINGRTLQNYAENLAFSRLSERNPAITANYVRKEKLAEQYSNAALHDGDSNIFVGAEGNLNLGAPAPNPDDIFLCVFETQSNCSFTTGMAQCKLIRVDSCTEIEFAPLVEEDNMLGLVHALVTRHETKTSSFDGTLYRSNTCTATEEEEEEDTTPSFRNLTLDACGTLTFDSLGMLADAMLTYGCPVCSRTETLFPKVFFNGQTVTSLMDENAASTIASLVHPPFDDPSTRSILSIQANGPAVIRDMVRLPEVPNSYFITGSVVGELATGSIPEMEESNGFVARITFNEDSTYEAVSWAQYISGATDTLEDCHTLKFVDSVTSPALFALCTTAGTVDGNPSLGGMDAYLFKVSLNPVTYSPSAVDYFQFGTPDDDRVRDMTELVEDQFFYISVVATNDTANRGSTYLYQFDLENPVGVTLVPEAMAFPETSFTNQGSSIFFGRQQLQMVGYAWGPIAEGISGSVLPDPFYAFYENEEWKINPIPTGYNARFLASCYLSAPAFLFAGGYSISALGELSVRQGYLAHYDSTELVWRRRYAAGTDTVISVVACHRTSQSTHVFAAGNTNGAFFPNSPPAGAGKDIFILHIDGSTGDLINSVQFGTNVGESVQQLLIEQPDPLDDRSITLRLAGSTFGSFNGPQSHEGYIATFHVKLPDP